MQNHSDQTPLPFYPHCFICGDENPNGVRCRFRAEGAVVRSVFKTENWMAGYEGTVHGGIIGAVLDEALVWAAYAATGLFGVTAEIRIRYLKPLLVGSVCEVKGRMVENKGKIWVAESELLLEDNTVLSRAEGKVIPMSTARQEQFKQQIKKPTRSWMP